MDALVARRATGSITCHRARDPSQWPGSNGNRVCGGAAPGALSAGRRGASSASVVRPRDECQPAVGARPAVAAFSASDVTSDARRSFLDVAAIEPAPRLIVNSHAGRKLGLSTNTATLEALESALRTAGVKFDTR